MRDQVKIVVSNERMTGKIWTVPVSLSSSSKSSNQDKHRKYAKNDVAKTEEALKKKEDQMDQIEKQETNSSLPESLISSSCSPDQK